MLAPASNAAWVLSICSETEIGTAGLSACVGTLPVIATQIIQGLDIGIRFSCWCVGGTRIKRQYYFDCKAIAKLGAIRRRVFLRIMVRCGPIT